MEEAMVKAWNILGEGDPVVHPLFAQAFKLGWNAGSEAERESCAKVCDEYEVPDRIEGAHPDYLDGKRMALSQAAHAIRMRSNC